jgi:hypothetical protein
MGPSLDASDTPKPRDARINECRHDAENSG